MREALKGFDFDRALEVILDAVAEHDREIAPGRESPSSSCAFAYERRRGISVVPGHIAELFGSIKRHPNAAAIEMAGPQTPKDSRTWLNQRSPTRVRESRIRLWTGAFGPDQRRA